MRTIRPPGKGNMLPCSSVQFSERVRGVMSACGLSIKEAAFVWGYSETTVKNWRRGASEPTWSEWEAIERAMGEFIKGTGT